MSPVTEMPAVLSLLKPYEGGDLSVSKVSTKVNNTRYNDPDCIEAID